MDIAREGLNILTMAYRMIYMTVITTMDAPQLVVLVAAAIAFIMLDPGLDRYRADSPINASISAPGSINGARRRKTPRVSAEGTDTHSAVAAPAHSRRMRQ